MTECISPATDGIQGATFGEWRLLQDSEITTLFTLTMNDVPVPDWANRTPKVEVWDGSAFLTIAPSSITKGTPPASTVAVKILAAQTHVPTITGWYRIGTTDLSLAGYVPHRYGPFIVTRTMRTDATLP